MANNFAGLRLLFQKVFGNEPVFQLDTILKLSLNLTLYEMGLSITQRSKDFIGSLSESLVPDLFLRWSHLCLVIEAKFFTIRRKKN